VVIGPQVKAGPSTSPLPNPPLQGEGTGTIQKNATAAPTPRRIALVALGLPVAIFAIDYLAFMQSGVMRGGSLGGKFFFAWLVLKAVILSWCAGRVLGFTVYGWIVFFWSQALLDVNTFAASHGAIGFYYDSLAHTLLSAQVGFLTVWTILGTTAFAWRLTSLLAALAVIIVYSRSLDTNWGFYDLPFVQWIAAAVVVGVCVILRASGFTVRRLEPRAPSPAEHGRGQPETFQFGVKHMLIWTAALAPLLVVVQSVDAQVLRGLVFGDAYPIGVLSLCIALATIAAIWLGLGGGPLVIRLAAAAAVIAGTSQLLITLGERWTPPRNNWNWRTDRFYQMVAEMDDQWRAWLAMLVGLLAAMLLFLRACDYRLAKAAPRKSNPLSS
jgi:hypothetical protein